MITISRSGQIWTDDELRKLYETHEHLLDLVSLFCYVPRSKYLTLGPTSAKLINIYRDRHHINAATGLNDPAVATGISDLVYDNKVAQTQSPSIINETTNASAASLGDDLWGNDVPGVNLVNEYLAGAGTDAPEVEEENIIAQPSVSYNNMWEKTLLEASEGEEDDARSSGASSPESTASFETSVSSQFGTMHYPSLFSSGPSYGTASRSEDKPATGTTSRLSNLSTVSSFQDQHLDSHLSRDGTPSYESTIMQRFESFENPMAGSGNRSNGSHDNGKMVALLDFFINKYVQCYGCGNPETEILISKTQMISLRCAACGYISDVDMREKLTTFILKKAIRNRVWGE